jgi:putative peptidoglycan lipid II flippase
LWLTREITPITALSSAIILAAGGGFGLLLYLLAAHRMRVTEVSSIIGLVTSRVGR